MVETYLSTRGSLLGLVLLIDIRRDPRKEEFEMAEYLAAKGIPFLVVLTKADKLSKTQQAKRLAAICSQLGREKNGVILFSAKTRQGRQTVMDEIDNLIDWYNEQGDIS